MSRERLEREVLSRIPEDQRELVKKLATGVAFAVPLVASWDMMQAAVGNTPLGTSNSL